MEEEIEVRQIPSLPDQVLADLGVRTVGARLRLRSAASQWVPNQVISFLSLEISFVQIFFSAKWTRRCRARRTRPTRPSCGWRRWRRRRRWQRRRRWRCRRRCRGCCRTPLLQLDQVDWFVFMLQSSFLIQCQVGSHTTSAMVPTEWTESQSSQTGGLTFLVPSRAAGPGKIRLQNANEFSHFLNF